MPSRNAISPGTETSLLATLHAYEGLGHLRVRKHGALLTIESGRQDDPVQHARFRKQTVSLWTLEIRSMRRWEPTPFRGLLDDLVQVLVENFGWVLTDIDPQSGTD